MTVLNLDCRHGLAMLPDNSVDAILTDPPYHLVQNSRGGSPQPGDLKTPFGRSGPSRARGFMGCEWDGGDIAFQVDLWREALRVLKPGGHMLAFSGSRTYHRMTCAIEDAGFEIRDSIMWVYGSGFPKSLDISKAIDKISATSTAWFGPWLKKWREATGVSQKELCERCGFFGAVNRGGTIANWELGLGAPSIAQFNIICRVLNLPFDSIEAAERSVIGTRKVNAGVAFSNYGAVELQITAPATMAAQIWEGWGTALKPAHEPICVARKPLALGTVAANVMAWGVGGINIDGCRVGTEPPAPRNAPKKIMRGGKFHAAADAETEMSHYNPTLGRWPANLIHDGSDEVLAGFPETKSNGGGASKTAFWNNADDVRAIEKGDSGSAARFFYCAKASKRDRNEGLEAFDAVMANFAAGTGLSKNGDGSPRNMAADAKNPHPTVKPTELMRYLCRLVTPPGGLIVDPFAGSGSTGKAAILEGFQFIGFELDPQYTAIANARIEHARITRG